MGETKQIDIAPDWRTYERRERCQAQRIKLAEVPLGARIRIHLPGSTNPIEMLNGDWITRDAGDSEDPEFDVECDANFRATWEGPVEIDLDPVEVRIADKERPA